MAEKYSSESGEHEDKYYNICTVPQILVSTRKLLDCLVFVVGKEYNKRRFGKRFLKCVL